MEFYLKRDHKLYNNGCPNIIKCHSYDYNKGQDNAPRERVTAHYFNRLGSHFLIEGLIAPLDQPQLFSHSWRLLLNRNQKKNYRKLKTEQILYYRSFYYRLYES